MGHQHEAKAQVLGSELCCYTKRKVPVDEIITAAEHIKKTRIKRSFQDGAVARI